MDRQVWFGRHEDHVYCREHDLNTVLCILGSVAFIGWDNREYKCDDIFRSRKGEWKIGSM